MRITQSGLKEYMNIVELNVSKYIENHTKWIERMT